MTPRAAVTVALVVLASGCGGEDPAGPAVRGAAPTSPGPAASTASPCPSSGTADSWPSSAPPRLPRPPGLRVVAASRQGGVSIIRFTTTQSLGDAAQFLVAELPKAGYTLRRGDSEGDEVDQPFTGRGRRASIKLRGSSACATQGTLVSQSSGR